MTDFKASLNASAHSYSIKTSTTMASGPYGAATVIETPVAFDAANESLLKEGLSDHVRRNFKNDTAQLASGLGVDSTKLWNYLIANHDTDGTKGTLSAEEISNGVIALDKANGLDGKLDTAKLDEKPADGGHDAHAAGGGHDAGHGGGEAKATQAMGKRDKVADKDEDQNGTKANLKSEDGKTQYHKDWTAYVKALDTAQGATKDGVVKDAADVKAMFGITDAAAEAIFEKAKEFKPNDITDGVGLVLQEIDKSDGHHDGKITIGKFNDYVEKLMETSSETAEKSEKSSKGGGGGGSSSKVEINNGAEAEALNKKIAELEKEIAELKTDGKPTDKSAKKKNNARPWLLAGAGVLAAGAAFFAIRDRNDRRRYNDQMAQYQQQCGPKPFPPPAPFCPPQPQFGSPLMFQGQFQGTANQTMFGNRFA